MITNAPAVLPLAQTTAEISGTNLNIAGNMCWINDNNSDTTNWFSRTGNSWNVTVNNLQENLNIIIVSGTNINGISISDSIAISRVDISPMNSEKEVPPIIDIINSPATISYSETAANISGMDMNISGQLSWENDQHPGNVHSFPLGFSVTIDNLEPGDNLITVSGANIYGQSTNSVVCIRRKLSKEVSAQISATALIFPASNSTVFALQLTNIIWNAEQILDDLNSTNLTISKISLHYADTTNQILIVTNDVANVPGKIEWKVQESKWAGKPNYVLNFEIVDSESLTNSRIFWNNKFTLVPEPVFIWIIGLMELWIIGRKSYCI